MKINKILSLILILIASLSTAYAATVYKWVDEDGQVHYGSRADNKDAKEVKIKKRNIDSENSAASVSAKQRADKLKKFTNALDAENESIAEQKRKKKEQKELKITRCNASRDQLKRYENSGALYDLDEKGNQILLNKKQYEQAMAQAKARVDKWCN